jgi:CP family cyanate transporter-like MFS transporter
VATIAPLYVPLGAAIPFALLLGLGQGISIALALYFIMARAATPAVAGALSGMAQGFGYLIAVAGPLAAGLLHSLTGAWDAPIGLLAALTALTLWFALLADRDLVIEPDGTTVGTARKTTVRAGVGAGLPGTAETRDG